MPEQMNERLRAWYAAQARSLVEVYDPFDGVRVHADPIDVRPEGDGAWVAAWVFIPAPFEAVDADGVPVDEAVS